MNEYSYEVYSKIFADSEYKFDDTYIIKGKDAEDALIEAKRKERKYRTYFQIKNFKKI